MKKINSIIIIGLLLVFSSCGDIFELDLQQDPNNPTPETADLESLYNSVQLTFENFLAAPQFFTMQLSRQIAFTAGNVYDVAYAPADFNNTWNQAYANFLPDANAVIALAEPTGQFYHTGTSRIMQGYVLTTLVDLFGDVPWESAGLGIENLSPESQDGATLYGIARDLITQGISELEMNTAPAPTNDFMYGGSSTGWIAAGNSLLMRLAVATRDQAAFNAIVDAGNFISGPGQDWQFEYSNTRANPDSRHPLYDDHYEADDGPYLGNWLMYVMNDEKPVVDPRIRGYFYRQFPSVPLDNNNRFDCIFSVVPDPASTPEHYLACDPNMAYCAGSLSDGYYGRDHGNGNGIPPDGDIRTRYGVYPMGGKFDNNSFINTQNLGTDGALGAGIHPILPSFFINFYRAEMAAVAGDMGTAREQLLAGVAASIDKVTDFIVDRDPNSLSEIVGTDIVTGEPTFGSQFLPSADAVGAYLDVVAQRFDEAADPMEVIALESLIAQWGNGIESYNLIRRTGRPSNIQPAILTSAGTFIRSALLPADHVNLNQNATQKTVLDQVFWDNTTLGPCFN
jgi:hypothetical protein